MSKQLPFVRKIEKYANEPVAFHLHKKNDFIQRIDKLDKNLDNTDEYEFQQVMKDVLETDDIEKTMNELKKYNKNGEKIKDPQGDKARKESMLK